MVDHLCAALWHHCSDETVTSLMSIELTIELAVETKQD
jgi:hypothetical protein